MMHTGQVVPLVSGQREPISQPGFRDAVFVLRLQGSLARGIFGKNPVEVGLDAPLLRALTHCQPEGRLLLSVHRHSQQMGF